MNDLNAKANATVAAPGQRTGVARESQDRSSENGTSAAVIFREFGHLQAHARASRTLNEWMAGAHAFALLQAATESGILDALCTPHTSAQIAAATHVDVEGTKDILLALTAYGVAQRDQDLYRLAPDWALLAAPAAVQPLANVVRSTVFKIRTLNTITQKGDIYTALSAADMLAIAQGLGASALSSASHVMTAGLGHGMPELKRLWEAGAHHLEVGCGVGNSLFGIATTFPKVTAVGIEIQPMVARETQRRANILGVADRVEVRQMDAGELGEEALYDTAQWSQTFFPAPTRAAVLRALWRAMKPGGYVFMPLLPEFPPDAPARRREMLRLAWHAVRSNIFLALAFLNDALGDTPARRRAEARFAALQRLLYSKWGVPARTATELQSEVQVAGFNVLRTMPMPSGQFSESRGLLLARKAAVT